MTFVSSTPALLEVAQGSTPAPVSLSSLRFETLETRLEADTASFWASMNPGPKPSFTRELLRDILAQQAVLRDTLRAEREAGLSPSLRYYVMGSSLPGIFNLGGDLGHFADRIRSRDLASLRRYGHLCVEAIHGNAEAFRSPVVTIAMVQGDALGGGFECALAFDVIVAERSAKFGLPEILFNLFPGMGAYSFLSRRIGAVEAEKMIMSGKLYTAEELHAMGVVDVLAEDGEGEAAVRRYIDQHSRKHNAQQALMRVRRRVNPVTLEELKDVVDIWAETAMGVTEMDLRKMVRLTQAQEKRINASSQPALARAIA
ncbi:crotonase/enoyl-CoA hydratase family protein [Sabulicella rubraurantiaca]|uniref:crotonase/enoyl-CoA hydratase family protein n=1 Tax=Sabulicella rubraurantiaca TaxID=2811429 RepID=UPI001A9686FF|nr:crotonase/enoyl-CoA hydratase family protein [Sabulicella rubraurantiaca]